MHILGKENLEQQEEADVATRHSGGPSANDHRDPGLGRADGGRSTADTKHTALGWSLHCDQEHHIVGHGGGRVQEGIPLSTRK